MHYSEIMIWIFSFWRVSFNRFDKWLFSLLLLRLLIPAIYNNIRVSILGRLSDNTSAFKVVSQLTWLQIAVEVFEEALLLPLYHCFGSAVNSDDLLRRRFRSGLNVCLVFYGGFCGILTVCTPELVHVMAQEKSLLNQTSMYLRLELASIFADGIGKFSDLFLVVKKKTRLLLIKLVIQMVCSILFDIFFFSNLTISLQLGINGVAYSSMARSFITLIVGLTMSFFTIKMSPKSFFRCHLQDYVWLKDWSIQGCFSGLDSFIRNAVYALIVIRGMNLLNEQGTYWLANTFIWSWLLLPVLALTEMLRQDIATNHPKQSYQTIFPAYTYLAIAILLCWAITFPSWEPFIGTVLNAKNKSEVVKLVYQLIPGYAFFILSSLSRSIFYAKGKIQFILVSCIAASVVLVVLFVMMIYHVFPSNVKVVAAIFETNMIVGAVVAILLTMRFIKLTNIPTRLSSSEDLNSSGGGYVNESRCEEETVNEDEKFEASRDEAKPLASRKIK